MATNIVRCNDDFKREKQRTALYMQLNGLFFKMKYLRHNFLVGEIQLTKT